jgi:dihydrofolate synthase / folylpolyglutamate synthase
VTEVFGTGRTLETSRTDGRFRFSYTGDRGRYVFTPGLAGRHQGANAATAIAATEVLARVWKPLDKAKVLAAIRETRWEGRLETVRRRPLVLLDGAHNVEGVQALAAHIRDVVRRPVILVFAAMQDKDLRAMTRILFPIASTIILTRVPYKRSATPEELQAAAPPFKGRLVLEPDTRKAVDVALAESRKRSGEKAGKAVARGRTPVVIAGSLFLIGEVKRLRLF